MNLDNTFIKFINICVLVLSKQLGRELCTQYKIN